MSRDESVTFSLRELEQLENERLEREKRQREDELHAMQRAKEEAERRAEEERTARLRMEADEKERARLREIEEEARREAMSRAAVEQARIEVEARTRADEADRERRHELELARIRIESKKSSGVGVVVGSGLVGFAVALGVCAGFYFGAIAPANARTRAALDGDVADANAKVRDLRSEAIDEHKKLVALQLQLDAANARIDELSQKAPSKPTTKGPIGTGSGPTSTVKKDPPPPDPCAGSKDPLCGLDMRHPH
ncbi:MAG TPA: hypothetical protein VIF62_15305 [Labilithrix sp.]|jgi:hypothetical protein